MCKRQVLGLQIWNGPAAQSEKEACFWGRACWYVGIDRAKKFVKSSPVVKSAPVAKGESSGSQGNHDRLCDAGICIPRQVHRNQQSKDPELQLQACHGNSTSRPSQVLDGRRWRVIARWGLKASGCLRAVTVGKWFSGKELFWTRNGKCTMTGLKLMPLLNTAVDAGRLGVQPGSLTTSTLNNDCSTKSTNSLQIRFFYRQS